MLLLCIPKINPLQYTLFFMLLMYPQVIGINILLYRRYRKHQIKFYFATAVMASFMIGFGLLETVRSFFFLPVFNAPLIGSIAFVIAAWFLVVERGYFNTKTWTDYIIEVTEKEKLLQVQNLHLIKAQTNAITVLTQTIEAKDPYTRGHCMRVRNYTQNLGKALGYTKKELQTLEYGALLHDIGKILIPGRIL